MSIWARINNSPDHHGYMKLYYDQKRMFEIRVYYASWIEERITNEKNPTEQMALLFYKDLQDHIMDTARTVLSDFEINEIISNMRQFTGIEFYSHLHKGISKEIELISKIPIPANSFTPVGAVDHIDELCNRIQTLIKSIDLIKPNIHSTCTEFEQIRTFCTIQATNEIKQDLEERYATLYYQRNVLVVQLKNMVIEYNILHKAVIDVELKNWQRQQALAGNGAPLNDNLNQIQSCVELLVGCVCTIAQLIEIMRKATGAEGGLDESAQEVRLQQELLILSAFIVEKQPPQVMKTNTRFAAAVRWLVGPHLGTNMNSPNVECIILSEAQAQRHCAQRQMSETPHSSGEILNNIGTMEYQQQSRNFSASFRNMQLKKIKRAEKKGTESVMDEKFALLFYTSVIVNDYRIRVWTLSLPVVVIVHGNQEPQSWATITWDNAFSEIVREPFQVPDKVSWARLSEALYTKYLSATGRGPTEENKHFLYEKLYRSEYMMDTNDIISWTQFCKDPLQDRTFTFWDWFFSTMKLTKDHLVGPWKADLIVGFINKRTAEDVLIRTRTPGTFLLRFSDSELGGITVAFLREDGNVLMLAPWTAKDLNVRGLSDRIQDLEWLKYVYPSNKNKDEVFGEFYSRTEEQGTRDGYVRNVIITTVPEMRQPTANSTPNHAHSPNPHDIHMGAGFQNSTLMHLNNLLFQAENSMEETNMDDILTQFAQNGYTGGI